MPKGRILFVDDESAVRSYVRAALTNAGFDVSIASDGEEALQLINDLSGEIDLLVTDIRMPKMDGICLADAVADLYPQIPVLFISGYPFDLEAEERKHPAKSCGFLKKPFLPQPLFEAVRKCLAPPSQAATA
jgi:two-component system cell cycle sensor histidine kinase/response regulator CckA